MADDDAKRLWYDEPATEWIEALPVGNGRLGAIAYGGLERERIQCNEDTLWAGGNVDRVREGAHEHLDEIRDALFAGEYEGAEAACNEHLRGDPPSIRPYQPFCDLLIDQPGHGDAVDYRRELDLRDGIYRVEYTVDGTTYTREYFASAPDDVLVVRIEADEPGAVDATARLDREREARAAAVGDELVLRGQVIDLPSPARADETEDVFADAGDGGWGLRFEGRAIVRHDGGSLTGVEGDHTSRRALEVSDADSLTVVFAAATDFDDEDPTDACGSTLASIRDEGYETLRSRHVEDHRGLMDRVSLDLGGPVDAPTDERLAALREGESDPALAALYFQYGRYLLAASSRPGSEPANLQGIWNEEYRPPWDSNYTLNVNLEMNYWHAQVANLAECADPLVSFVDSLRDPGRSAAREHYDCDGFVAHLQSDLWRTPVQTVDARWGYWPMAAAWLCRNCWDHYAFSGDRADLERIYPILREAAEFLLDFLVEHPDEGWLVTAPSASPENRFRTPDGQVATVCEMPTMDVQLVTDLFGNCVEAAEALDRDPDFAADLEAALDRLPPMQVGRHGQLQEWLADFEEVDPGHRHVSHLVGFYPADLISLREDPELADAVRTSLERRLENGGGHTGWSCAWTVALFARLEDGERAGEHVRKLLGDSTYDSLLDSHPPFQIDGNFGGAAGIAEMLLGSHGGEMRLLPALPEEWSAGSVDGLRGRGGFEVDLSWRDGRLEAATVRATRDSRCRLRTSDVDVDRIETDAGDPVDCERLQPDVVAFPATAGESYRVVPADGDRDRAD